MPTCELARAADVRAVLTDPCFVVATVAEAGPADGIGWLRASVARFASGPAHECRRALAVTALAGVSPAGLRRRARERTDEVLAAADGPVDLMAEVARPVPLELLAAALGLPAGCGAAVLVVVQAYLSPLSHPAAANAADRAVATLVDACGGLADEQTAARIGLLVQACDATAGLVGNAAFAMLPGSPAGGAGKSATAGNVDTIVHETLRRNPPVRSTRRVASVAGRVGSTEVAAGTVLRLDLAAADLPFGAGAHCCPGQEHSVALAAGVLEAVRGWRVVQGDIEYEPPENLRVPRRLELTR